MNELKSNWAEKELGGIRLGDRRLNNRLIKVADDLSRMPTSPINQACKDWNATKAAYRLFGNERIDYTEILRPHIESTINRIKDHKLVLAIQDTTEIDYTSHKATVGLGRTGNDGDRGKVKGLLMHSTLLLSNEGVPLGLLTEEIVTRCEKRDIDYKSIPTEEKESYKWIDALEKTIERLPADCDVLTVCDREADLYDMFLAAKDLGTHVLVRNCYDRRVEVEGERQKSLDHIRTVPVSSTLEILVPLKKSKEKNGRKVVETIVDGSGNRTRPAIIEIRYGKYTLIPPVGIGQIVKEKLDVFMVQAKEIDVPDEYEPIEWNLLTTLDISSNEEASSLIKIYQQRWMIEVYFKVLKSGCKIEDCRLGKASRLIKFVALFSIIAWRLYWITHISRVSPNETVDTILTENEWKALFAFTNNGQLSTSQIPSVHDAIIRIACLGGYLNRKCDLPPGPTVIWRGWMRLQDLVSMWNLVKFQSSETS